MSRHLVIIREIFPGQVYLTPREIARVLYGPGRDTKKRVEGVRKQLDDRSLVPGLRKAQGQKRWKVSVVELAMALDRRAELAGLEQTRPATLVWGRKSRFKNPGPRLVR